MTVIVCPLQDVAAEIAAARPARVISLLAPEQDPPAIPGDIPRLRLSLHDIASPHEGLHAPGAAHIDDLLAFGHAWREPEPLLIHCLMGISRSTAAALILACALDPRRDEAEAARALRAASPTATPNPLMIALADARLKREGRLIAAAEAIGRGAFAACGKPFRMTVRSRPA